ncbi:hypothetical protein Fmac_006625 [Flemingia macrophylla]|uniref:SAM domain-containing protein n=1 Tax=Flemingia macrophylla TaxID=520843 RepID=A0ABD1NB60_9FABA
MVKTKQRRTGKVPAKKNGTSSQCLTDSPNCDDQIEDRDWIIVKKQRVTILVPAAPFNERSLTADKGPNHMHLMPPEIASNHVLLPNEISTNPSGNEHEKTTSLAVQREARAERRAPPPTLPKPIVVNPPSVDQRIESENLHQMNILKPHKLGISDASKVKQTRTLHAPRMSPNLESLNKNLRASNLQRKLERAGGLNKWLASLGLEQFVSIFHGRSISKYQLVNLTMKKLKDMGASAVGPRRKLIHAMDCVCQPYCFQSL